MKTKNVVVITDCKDVAFNEMKWIILQECKKLGFENVNIELISVSEFSIINASFLTRLIAEQCPSNTVFSVVINPQKHRSARIYGKTKNGMLFFGANTGALNWFLEEYGIQELYEVNDPGFITFGGKYVHAPNVAKLVAEIPFKTFGKKFSVDKLSKLEIPNGTIVHIDNFGLMKIKGETPKYNEGQKFKVFVNGEYKLVAVFSNRMMSREDKEWVLYVGSSLHGLPELGTVRYKEGYKNMNFKIGDIVTWEELK
jgi:S-adenosylmethionine hydrolase